MASCCFLGRSTRPRLRTIRVIHFDGYIEDFEGPATVNQVLTIFPKHFITTPIRLMQVGLVPLKLDTQLESGRIYFLLPCSFIKFNESSSDLTCLTKKLTNIAKTRQLKQKPTMLPNPQDKGLCTISLPNTNVAKDHGPAPVASPQVKKSTQKSLTKILSNIAKPPRVKRKPSPDPASTNDKESSDTSNDDLNHEPDNMRKSTKFSWKPLLSTIREISFNRRESDLRD